MNDMTRTEALERLNKSIVNTEEARLKSALSEAKYDNYNRQLDKGFEVLPIMVFSIF